MALTDTEQQERDPAAIQRELLDLADQAQAIGAELVQAEAAYHAAMQKRAVLKAKATWIKQRTQALQSVLKSLQYG